MLYKNRIGEPQNGTVILVHGQGEHSGRYQTIIQMLTKRGYAVEFFDWPGHGKSSGKQGHTSIEEGTDIIDSIVNNLKSKPFLIGHSMGGLAAIRYTEIYPEKIRGIILSSPELAFDKRIPSIFHHISRFFSLFFHSKTIYNRIRPEELSRNKKVVEQYIQDPLVHNRISLSSHRSIFNSMGKAFQESSRITGPMLILVGTDDMIVPSDRTKKFFEQLILKDKTLLEFQGAYHEISEDPEWGESFRNEIMKWIADH